MKPPKTGRAWLADAVTPGLQLAVSKSGVRAWSWIGRVRGRVSRVTIGRFPAVSTADAREAVRVMLGDVARGRDPGEAKRHARGEPTFGSLCDAWIKRAREEKVPSAALADERSVDAHLRRWGNRLVSEVRRGDVQTLFDRLTKDIGRYGANRVLNLVRSMYKRVERLVQWRCDNPAVEIDRHSEVARTRFLTEEELPRFFAAVEAEQDQDIRDVFCLALTTGLRKNNVMALEWCELDMQMGLLSIPSRKTKANEPIVVPLHQAAWNVLRHRQAAAEKGTTFVFPAPRGASGGHAVWPQGQWERVVKRAGLEDFRAHDLRRSFGSWLAIQGTPLHIIGKLLGHRDGSAATAVYARLSIAPLREAAQKGVGSILAGVPKAAPATCPKCGKQHIHGTRKCRGCGEPIPAGPASLAARMGVTRPGAPPRPDDIPPWMKSAT